MGFETTEYMFVYGSNLVEVCLHVSEPSSTTCPITFPFKMVFHLLNPTVGMILIVTVITSNIVDFIHTLCIAQKI